MVAIEILQVLFPPRTVSQNDITAGWLGGITGILIWVLAGARLWRLAWAAAHPHRETLLAGIGLYTLAYIVFSLFPYDFLLNAQELSLKLTASPPSFLPVSCAPVSRCIASFLAEIIAVAPLGIALALWQSRGTEIPPGLLLSKGWMQRSGRGYLQALLLGAALGLIIESLQFFIYTGVSQGLSILTRALGVTLGWALSGWLFARPLEHRRFQLRPWTLGLLPLYLLALFVLSGLSNASWGGWRATEQKIATLRLLPFYYHYYITESMAMISLIQVFGAFLPLGFALWPWQGRLQHAYRSALIAGMILAAVVEFSKLFAIGLRPDPTNVLIAAIAAWTGLGLLNWLAFALRAQTSGPAQVPYPLADKNWGGGAEQLAAAPSRHGFHWRRGLGIALGTLVFLLAFTWPVAALALTLGLAGYALWLWRVPQIWLVVIPALAPILDLAPYTGQVFFNEWDLLVLTTLAVGWLHSASQTGTGLQLPRSVLWALALYMSSMFLSLIIVLWPLPPLDANAFTTYMSPYNGLRVAKGLTWAVLLASLLGRSGQPVHQDLEHWFVPGMALGLMGSVAAVLWERATYPGFLDFSAAYRATALFFDMHLGGPTIETFQVLTLPFLLFLIWRIHRGWTLPLAGALLLGVAYAALVTYSRGGYLGTVVVLLTLGVALAVHSRKATWQEWGMALTIMALPVVAALVLLVGMDVGNSFLRQRMQAIQGAIEQRHAHWSDAVTLRSPGLLPALLGEGLGSYPRIRLLHRLDQPIPLNFRYEPGRLQLRPGEALYFDQRISLEPFTDYSLEARARAVHQTASLRLFVCEKHILYSYRCRYFTLELPPDGQWQTGEWAFNSGDMGTGSWMTRRSLAVSLAHGGAGMLEVDTVSLHGPDEREILQNGDFAQGSRHWFYAVDDYSAYRAENQWLEVYIEQGWFGLLSFVLLLGTALLQLAQRMLRGELTEATCLAALLGALMVGLWSTVFWSPRVATLFYLVLLVGLAKASPYGVVRISPQPQLQHGQNPH